MTVSRLSGLICILTLSLIVPVKVHAQSVERAVGTFLITSDYWCPYTCDPKSSRPGFLVELAREIFEARGETVIYEALPLNRSYLQTEQGISSISLGVVQSDTRTLIYSKEVLATDNTVLVMRKNAEALAYTAPSVLDDLVIGVGAEYVYDNSGQLDQYLAERREKRDRIIEIFSETPLESLFPMLMSGRINVFPENEDVVRYVASRKDLMDDIVIIQTGLGNLLYGGFTPTEVGARNLAIFDEGVRRLRASGRLQQIRSLYGLAEESQIPMAESPKTADRGQSK